MGQRTGPRSPSEIRAEETLECRRGVLVQIHSWAARTNQWLSIALQIKLKSVILAP